MRTLYTRKLNISAVVGAEIFGEYWSAFSIIHAVNTHENGIFRQLLVPKYSGEYCFAFGIICALNTHENIISPTAIKKIVHHSNITEDSGMAQLNEKASTFSGILNNCMR